MTTNLIHFPMRWLAEQIEQSGPFADIRAEVTEVRAALAEIRGKLDDYSARLMRSRRGCQRVADPFTAPSSKPGLREAALRVAARQPFVQWAMATLDRPLT